MLAKALVFVAVLLSQGATAQGNLCELPQCTTVCPSNLTDFQESIYSCDSKPTTTLKLLTSNQGLWATAAVERFSAQRPDVNVEIIEVKGNFNLFENIINEAKSKTGLFDLFITPPHVMGDIVEEDGWADLTEFVESNVARDWSDIILGYRKWISQFQDKILMFPLDGDVLSMYYREDILEEFGLQVPRTWDEYSAVAEATHGKTFQNKTLTGSCVGRMPGCAGAYWINLMLSSMTQNKGASTGFLFDTFDMKPLLGEAFEQTLEWLETQAKYGAGNQLEGCIGINIKEMNSGECVLTYNWGNSFSAHLTGDSVFANKTAKFGVAKTPGSTHVLDRSTMKLVSCTEDLCSTGGVFYDDIGWVNQAPYLAFGGWSCAVNNYTTPEKKALATELCAFASSQTESNKFFQRDATDPVQGADPFRESQLDINLWVQNGYEPNSVLEYFQSINGALGSENAVTDIRFPQSNDFYSVLDREVFDYLNGTLTDKIQESERSDTRKDITDRIQKEFNTMIDDYNGKASTKSTLLEQYQKLRNVYYVEVDFNYLGKGLRYYGFTIGILQLVLPVAFAIWTYINRENPVIRASQPFFLILLCVGVFTFSASIIPLAIDDEFHSTEAASSACMSFAWLASLGWSILFSALYAKLRRINLVVSNAMKFRSVTVSVKDMMITISILFSINLLLMTLWNILDPLIWKRTQVSPSESFGTCTVADTGSITAKIIGALIGVLNGGVLISANIEAYKARKIDTEYGESVYIGLIMLFFLQIALVGVPLFFVVHNNRIARFFLSTSVVSIMSMTVLFLIFIPKFVIYRRRLNENENEESRKSNIQINGLAVKRPNAVGFVEAKQAIDAQIVYEKTWKERIASLEVVLQEAGVDGKTCLRNANIIGEDNKIIPVKSETRNETSKASRFSFMGGKGSNSSKSPETSKVDE